MDNTATRRAFACALGAVVLLGLYGWLQNSVLFPRFAEFFPIGREIDTAVRAALYAAVALVANRRPDLLDAKTIAATGIVAIASSTVLLYAAVTLESGALAVAGVAFFEVGYIWVAVFYGLALCLLPTPRHTALAAAFGAAASNCLELFVGTPAFPAGMAALAALPLAALALSWAPASRFLSEMQRQPAPSELEIAHPRAFLRPTSALFACILAFSVASGFGLTLNEVGHAPNQSAVAWIAMLGIAGVLALRRKPGGEDALFSFSVLLIIAGFLAAPFTFGTESAFANAPLRIGRTCVEILALMAIAAVGKRNPLAMITALCMADCAQALGTIAGAVGGHTVNDLVGAGDASAQAMTACALFAFVAFLWLGFRRFSFEAAIDGIEKPTATVGDRTREASLDEACAAIGKAHGLTGRETEIFAMMARGRNVSFVQEHFVISRNTVKTHVKRIYKKLGVHSQQELIDLVEAPEDRA